MLSRQDELDAHIAWLDAHDADHYDDPDFAGFYADLDEAILEMNCLEPALWGRFQRFVYKNAMRWRAINTGIGDPDKLEAEALVYAKEMVGDERYRPLWAATMHLYETLEAMPPGPMSIAAHNLYLRGMIWSIEAAIRQERRKSA